MKFIKIVVILIFVIIVKIAYNKRDSVSFNHKKEKLFI